MPKFSNTITERFWKYVDKCGENECWEWRGALDKEGYGRLYTHVADNGVVRMVGAHRLSWEIHKGPISKSLQIDHLCRNRKCVNPGHLEPVTCAVNIRRGLTGKGLNNHQNRKTHCQQGHPFSGTNLVINSASHARMCRTCKNATERREYAQRRALGHSPRRKVA